METKVTILITLNKGYYINNFKQCMNKYYTINTIIKYLHRKHENKGYYINNFEQRMKDIWEWE